MGKKPKTLPAKIEMQGWLVKAGGADGKKKKKQRYFTMGDGMIAYFDCKKPEQAKMGNCKGWFPIDQDSNVEKKGAVDGAAYQLPWAKGYMFQITSVGRAFQLFAEDVATQSAWVISTVDPPLALSIKIPQLKPTPSRMRLIYSTENENRPHLNLDAGGAFEQELERFRTACTTINTALSAAVSSTGDTARQSSYDLTEKLGKSADSICNRMSEVQKKMDVLMTRSLDIAKTHQARQLKKFETTVLSSEQREVAAAELDEEKEVINAAGAAVLEAETAVRDVILKMQSSMEEKLDDAYAMIVTTLDESKATAKIESEKMFGELRTQMSKVGQLGGAEPLDDNWWSSFKSEFSFLEELFDAADADGSGSITCSELRDQLEENDEFLEKMNGSLSRVTTEDIFAAIDSGGDGEVTFAEFSAFASAAEFLPTFRSADADGSGSIDMGELKAVLVAMNYVSADEVDEFVNDDVFAKFDADGDGDITFPEFAKAMALLQAVDADDGSDDDDGGAEPEPES